MVDYKRCSARISLKDNISLYLQNQDNLIQDWEAIQKQFQGAGYVHLYASAEWIMREEWTILDKS